MKKDFRRGFKRLLQLEPQLALEMDEVFDAVAALPPAIPGPKDAVAVSIRSPKTAALVYDRVWTGVDDGIPESVAVHMGTAAELRVRCMEVVNHFTEAIATNLKPNDLANPRINTTTNEMRHHAHVVQPPVLSRFIVEALATKDVTATPIYSAQSDRDKEFKSGSRDAIVGILSGIPLPIEDQLSWAQVMELRADHRNRTKLRRFTHWLDKEMVGRSEAFIQDEIGVRLEDYKGALSVHGIKTLLGALSATLDSKILVGGAATLGSVSYAAGSGPGMVAATAILVGNAAVTLAKTLLDIRETRMKTNPEIAFVAELERLTTK